MVWRNLWKNKLFSLINIAGLSAGLACCILIFLFVQHELSYDKFNKQAANIYRLRSDMESNGGKTSLAVTPAPWAPLMKKDFPEIREYTRLLKDEKAQVGRPGEQQFYETGMLYADATFFQIFSLHLDRGDQRRALEKPNSIVLTAEAARQYFGKADPIGKTLEVNSYGRSFNLEVTAIARKMPAASHINFHALVSMQTLGDLSNLWSFHMFQSYLLLNNEVAQPELEKKFAGFVKKYILNNPQADGSNDIYLQRLTDIHLHSHLTGELGPNGDIMYVYGFAGVAVFILLLACFNFTNLTTASSLARAKEVGLRKVMGSGKRQLLFQFMGETAFFTFISLLLAILLSYLFLPVFSRLSGRELSPGGSDVYSLAGMLVALLVVVSLLAGLYPALVLSAFKPIEILKGKFTRSSKGVSFRKFLVTLQFAVSIALIACTLLVNGQLRFLQNKKLGFDKENVVVLTLPRNADSMRLQSFKTALLANKAIRSVAASSAVPNDQIAINQVNDGSADLSKALSMQMLFTDAGFARTLHMQLVAGRDISNELVTDKAAGFVLNEEAVKKLGWKSPQQAIGKTVQWVQPNMVLKSGQVIGVVKDFHITPLRSAVQPLVMHYFPQRFQYLYVRFDQSRATDVISLLQQQFKSFYTNQSFEYNFLDDALNNLYTSEKKLGLIFTCFSSMAIFIACLGVLGLSLYSIRQRVKEIGIRKVLGASVPTITIALIREFVQPVLIAAVIASPLAWWVMNKWLQDFAYRIPIGWPVFLLATALVLLLAVLTMLAQSIQAALANPVKSLRTE